MTEEFRQYMSPLLYFSLMTDGITFADVATTLAVGGGYGVVACSPNGMHPRHQSMLTQYTLTFNDTQWLKQDRGILLTRVSLTIDAMPAGWAMPLVIDTREHPNDAPGALLHWLKDNPYGDWDNPDGWEQYSLMVTRGRTA